MSDGSKANSKLDAVVSKMKATTASTALAAPPPPLVGREGAGKAPTTSGASRSTNNTARETNEALQRAIRMNEMTNDLGGGALTALGKQSETIQHSIAVVDDTNTNLRDSRRSLREMRLQYWKDLIGKALVIGCLLLIIALIVYKKWIQNLRGQ